MEKQPLIKVKNGTASIRLSFSVSHADTRNEGSATIPFGIPTTTVNPLPDRKRSWVKTKPLTAFRPLYTYRSETQRRVLPNSPA